MRYIMIFSATSDVFTWFVYFPRVDAALVNTGLVGDDNNNNNGGINCLRSIGAGHRSVNTATLCCLRMTSTLASCVN
jgi:hypothetical protein